MINQFQSAHDQPGPLKSIYIVLHFTRVELFLATCMQLLVRPDASRGKRVALHASCEAQRRSAACWLLLRAPELLRSRRRCLYTI